MTDEQSTPQPQPSDHHDEGSAEPKSLSYVSVPALLTAIILSMVLLSGALYFWWVLGPSVRAQVSTLQLATLVLFLIVMLAMMLGIGYSHLWAGDGQVVVRNGPFIKHYPIDQIAGLRLRKGDPWAYLLVKDETTETGYRRRATLAIQSLEGEGAQRKVRALRRWLKANGATSGDLRPNEDDAPR
uniref:PH domain-containing protein n=1 Tax=Tessaracoccus timonensis TaxID=2161816 RepID=UPI000D54C8A5|nr:PH domain-containing protein [Tessaracoccus timonensis]